MRTKFQRFGKYIGYGIFTLVATLYFSFLTFPYDVVKDRYLSTRTQGLPFRISVDTIRATPFLWIEATGLQIIPKTNDEKISWLTLPEARVKPSLFHLLTGRVAFRVKALLYGGKIKGRAGRGKDTIDLSLDWKNVALNQLPVQSRWPEAALTGKVDGAMDLRLRVQGNRLLPGDGTCKIRLAEGSAKNLRVQGFPLPALEGITGQGDLVLGQNRVTLESLSLNADVLSVSFEGKVDLSRRLASSPLNLKGKIKLSGTLASQYQPMLAGLLRKQDSEGFYVFSIRGTLTHPRFSL